MHNFQKGDLFLVAQASVAKSPAIDHTRKPHGRPKANLHHYINPTNAPVPWPPA